MKKSILIRIITYILLLILLCGIIFVMFKNEKIKEELEDNKLGLIDENTILPTPNRIIYKNQYDEYIIIESYTSEYVNIYSEFYNQITNIIEGKVYSEEEIAKMQNNGSFVEFDYNTKSNNFIFLLEEEEVGIIKRFSDSGQVIQTSLNNTNELIKKLDKLTKKSTKHYSLNEENDYFSENKLTEFSDFSPSTEEENNVYTEKIENNNESIKTSNDEYSVNYYVENSKYYAIVNEEKIEIISLSKACDLADKEAQNSNYQYQPWKSEFYSRGANKTDYASGELISDLSDISKLYHWNENWKKLDYKNVNLMWKIRLFDENDPLTSLYIYIDAISGNVVGAGDSSD